MSSRQEDMLTAIANGDIINDEPRCRREQYLKAIANGEGTANLPEPNCREEALLNVIAEKGIGGGGGITPSGTLEINQNGTHDVTNYASANVSVPAPSELIYETYVSDFAGSLNGLWKLLYGTQNFGIFVEFDKANLENFTEGEIDGSNVYGVLTPTPCRLIMYSNGVKNVGTAKYIFGVETYDLDNPTYPIKFVECDANWQGLGLDQILLYYNPSSNTVTHFPTDDPSSIDGFIMYKLEDINLQDKVVTENGEVYHDMGYEGLGKVTVNVEGKEDLTTEFDTLDASLDNLETFVDGMEEGGCAAASGLPIELSTDEEMASVLTEENVGKVYKFVGTSETYETDAIYIVSEVE